MVVLKKYRLVTSSSFSYQAMKSQKKQAFEGPSRIVPYPRPASPRHPHPASLKDVDIIAIGNGEKAIWQEIELPPTEDEGRSNWFSAFYAMGGQRIEKTKDGSPTIGVN